MEITEQCIEGGDVFFYLSPPEVETAIREFICKYHPEVANGYSINPAGSSHSPTRDIQYVARKAK